MMGFASKDQMETFTQIADPNTSKQARKAIGVVKVFWKFLRILAFRLECDISLMLSSPNKKSSFFWQALCFRMTSKKL